MPERFEIRSASLGPLATNAYAFRAREGWVLIDAPAGVADWLEGEGVAPDLLLLTHVHFDHVLGAAEVVERFGCPVWGHSKANPELTLEGFFGGFAGTGFAVSEFGVDRLLDGGVDLEVEACGTPVGVLPLPGHSADSLCFRLPEHGVVFAGDTLFCGGLGRTDFPGGSAEQLVAGIREKLLTLDGATRILPGHGSETTVGAESATNPFV